MKSKLNIEKAVKMVEDFCRDSTVSCGDALNLALEKIVNDCTTTITIKSNHRIIRPHINRELILAVRERDRLYTLTTLYGHNTHLVRLYCAMKLFVKMSNEKLRGEYEFKRIELAAGDDRKTWKLYKEIVFNQSQLKRDQSITINGNPVTDSIDSCNDVNEHFCSAGEILATNIISVHGYLFFLLNC